MGARDAPTRQQSLRATLDWSYDLLGVTERAVLRRLAIFAGGCSLDAVEAVCTGIASQALTALLTLVDKHLVRQDESDDGMSWYRLLETVRAYALERLQVEEAQNAAARNHARYYLALAEQAAPLLDGPHQTIWLNRLEAEHNNMRVALRWFLDATHSDSGLRLASALESFWSTRGYISEGRSVAILCGMWTSLSRCFWWRGGSGIVPLMAMLRHRAARGSRVPTRLLYSSRSIEEVIYKSELDRLVARADGLEVFHTLTRAQPAEWRGYSRRIDRNMLAEVGFEPERHAMYMVCGPTALVESVASALVGIGYPPERVKTERFGPTGA